MYEGVTTQFLAFLAPALVEVSCQLQIPFTLLPGNTAPATHWMGGWVSPRTSTDAVAESHSAPTRKRKPVFQYVAVTMLNELHGSLGQTS
jgi:hypothetical protein